jgi:hypothetical protein
MTLLSQLARALNGVYNFKIEQENHRIVFTMTDNDVKHYVLVTCNEAGQVIALMMKYIKKTPQLHREEMCVFMNEVNKSLMLGGFEMDVEDGECQYRHSVDVESLDLKPAFWVSLVKIHVLTGCKYWPGILAVQNGLNCRTAQSRVN